MRLKNLKGKRQIHRSRYAGQKTFLHRIGRRAVREVLLLLFHRPWLVRNAAIGRIDNDAKAGRRFITADVMLNIRVSGVSDLPYTLKIRLTRRCVWWAVALRARIRGEKKDGYDRRRFHQKKFHPITQ